MILVAAGANGAGKSSIVQPYFESIAGSYFNPDEAARELVTRGIPQQAANQQAWAIGYQGLCEAVETGGNYAFETTLGGHSIPFQLMRALAFGRPLVILYVGLASVELHLQRIRERVARGGHDIPSDKVRQRYDDSRRNLLWFIGTAAAIRVWDNSEQSADGKPSRTREILRTEHDAAKLMLPDGMDKVPDWTKPLFAQIEKLGLELGTQEPLPGRSPGSAPQ